MIDAIAFLTFLTGSYILLCAFIFYKVLIKVRFTWENIIFAILSFTFHYLSINFFLGYLFVNRINIVLIVIPLWGMSLIWFNHLSKEFLIES